MKILIDSENEKQFKYINSIIRGDGKSLCIEDGTKLYSSMINANPGLAVETFEIRYNNDEIPTCFNYDKFLANTDLQNIITGLGLDPEPFWLLAIFCFDYALDKCNGIKCCDYSINLIEQFVQVIGSCNEDESIKSQITLKSGKSTITLTKGRAFSKILEWIKQGYDSIENKDSLRIFDKTDIKDIFTTNEESDSVIIWYFATLMRYFFELNPQFKAKAKKHCGVSLSKNLLISYLVYHLGLSKNPSFIESDETIKGFYKQYKDKKITTLGNIYLI